LAHLKGLANLTLLDLGVTQVSDSGLAHLKGLTNLTQLWLYSTPVSDAGLAHLKGLTNLETLGLGSTRVTDAGLESLAGLSRLQRLYLETNLRITDAGLVHLKGLSNLQELHLGSTQVSDAGLPILLLLGSTLEKIWIDNTHISAKGSTTLLRAGRPRVQLFWKDGNREAVKLLLARGGKVHIRLRDQKEDRPIQDARELLLVADSFQITRISLAGLTQLPDDLLRTLARQTDPVVNHLEVLDLSGTGFQEVYLQQVFLFRWQFSLFAQHSGLRYHIHEFDRGEFAHLVDLSLANTQINNAALEYLNELKKLERLSLTGCRLSDEGLKHLPVLTTLQELDLRQTQVTAAGKSALQKALPKCKILLTAGAADHRGK
jgi:Leucine-rich repeat (LRR) protein